jgi:hypothetical protein
MEGSKLEIGDYLTAKIRFRNTSNKVILKKNKKYRIDDIYCRTVVQKSGVGYTILNKFDFNFVIKGEFFNESEIDKFFYSKIEERKLKLETINNESISG